MAERIRFALMDEITTGQLPSGAVLDEASLGARFNASRTPVRDALRQLEGMGLIELRPRRGAIVLPMTVERLGEMFEVLAEVEAMCARFAACRMTGLDRVHLADLQDECRRAAENGDVERYDRANLDLHQGIYRAMGNEFLKEHVEALNARLKPFRRTQLRYGARLCTSCNEHDVILKLMSRGDVEGAGQAMREHMLNASIAMIRFLDHSQDIEEKDTESR